MIWSINTDDPVTVEAVCNCVNTEVHPITLTENDLEEMLEAVRNVERQKSDRLDSTQSS